jgi:putative sterol carrier protein
MPKDILTRIPVYFQPKKAKSRKLIIAYEIRGDEVTSCNMTVIINGDKCEVVEGIADNFDTKVVVTAGDYLRWVYGKMEYGNAIWMGRIKLVGSSLAHEELNTYFSFPKKTGIVFI